MLKSWKSRAAVFAVAATMAVPVLSVATPAGAAAGGNSANAKACQKGGWDNWVRDDQTPFANQGECMSYGAQGGMLTSPLPPLPDLVPVVSCVVSAAEYNCTLAVRNDGLSVASDGWGYTSAVVLLDGSGSWSDGVGSVSLVPGDSYTFAGSSGSGADVGSVTVDVTLDTTNIVAESNETNNTFHQVFNVT